MWLAHAIPAKIVDEVRPCNPITLMQPMNAGIRNQLEHQTSTTWSLLDLGNQQGRTHKETSLRNWYKGSSYKILDCKLPSFLRSGQLRYNRKLIIWIQGYVFGYFSVSTSSMHKEIKFANKLFKNHVCIFYA